MDDGSEALGDRISVVRQFVKQANGVMRDGFLCAVFMIQTVCQQPPAILVPCLHALLGLFNREREISIEHGVLHREEILPVDDHGFPLRRQALKLRFHFGSGLLPVGGVNLPGFQNDIGGFLFNFGKRGNFMFADPFLLLIAVVFVGKISSAEQIVQG